MVLIRSMGDEKEGDGGLTRLAASNFRWSALSIASVSGSHFVIGILLARILEPNPFRANRLHDGFLFDDQAL